MSQRSQAASGPPPLILHAYGAALALAGALILCGFIPPPDNGHYQIPGTLAWSAQWSSQEFRKKGFYVLFLILALMTLAGASRLRAAQVILQPWVWLLLALFVPVFADSADYVMVAPGQIPTLISFLPLTVLIAGAVCFSRIPASAPLPAGAHDLPAARRFDGAEAAKVFAGLLLLAVLIFPSGPKEVASRIGYDFHVSGFITGSATYQYQGSLIPGRDYYTQYSLGLPAIFYHLLGRNAAQTLAHYSLFFSTILFLFYSLLLVFTRWLYDSVAWGLGLCIFVFIMQCHFPVPFSDPSSFPLRYPLLIVICFSFARWGARSFSLPSAGLHGAILGAALFLNTETGIYSCAATVLLLLCARGDLNRAIAALAVMAGSLVTLFFLLCALAFGTGVFSWGFVAGLIEPVMLFASGMGCMPMLWTSGWYWYANIVCPLLCAATVGWTCWRFRLANSEGARDREGKMHLLALAFVALMSLLMAAKYVNMSLLAVWMANATCSTVILGYWLVTLFKSWRASSRPGVRMCGKIFPVLSLVIAVGIAASFTDPRNPTTYALQSYLHYPSIFNRLTKIYRRPPPAIMVPPDPVDVALIQHNTKRTERVALYDFYDWAYLIEARRSSYFRFIPSVVIFTQKQLGANEPPPRLVFLPIELPANYGVPPETLVPDLWTHYKEVARGKHLRMLMRNDATP